MLSFWSLIAIAFIVAGIVVAWSGRFMAVGALVAANVAVFILGSMAPTVICPTADGELIARGLLHCELGADPEALAAWQPIAFLQLLTSMFLHADFSHILGNLIILVFFAVPFEDRIGPRAFTVMYVLTGLVGAVIMMATIWDVPTRLFGASGAVFGIVGAFAGAYPRLVVPLPVPIGIIIIMRVRVIVAALIAAGLQVLFQFISSYNPGASNVAYLAHLGGLGAGLVIAATYMRYRKRRGDDLKKMPLDLAALAPFAVDESGRKALSQMKLNHDEPEVFEAWLERFLVAARSPDTGAPVALRKGKLISTKGEQFDVSLPP